MRWDEWYVALVPLPVFRAFKACRLAAMTSPTCSFFHQVSYILGQNVPIHEVSCMAEATADNMGDQFLFISEKYLFAYRFVLVSQENR